MPRRVSIIIATETPRCSALRWHKGCCREPVPEHRDLEVGDVLERREAEWRNEERIKLSLGGMSPVQHRRPLGLAA